MSAVPALERLLKRDGAITIVGVFVLCALTWAYIAAGAGLGMSAWDMTTLALLPQQHTDGPATEMGAMTPMTWGPKYWALMVGMWWTMMIAMMTPSAAPTILLYARVHRHALEQGHAQATHAPTGMFAAGYFLMWLVFSIAAAALHQVLQRAGIISAMTMGSQVRWLSGTALVVTGLYQLSPLKNACLSHCRAPAAFLSRHWRPRAVGALRLGVMHGAYCIGCCWMLMVLLFVGGVMNLAWIAALSLLVLAEKILKAGRWVGRGAGIVLVAWGATILLG
jgi:predicted metal-binding membrane protein